MSDTIEIPTDVPVTQEVAPVTQEVAPVTEPEPPKEYLFDVATLVSEHDLLLKKEAEDRAIANTVEFPDTTAFKAKLVEWASKGFPGAYPVFSVTLNPPAVCSDGVVRDVHEYFTYVAGATLGEKMQGLTNKLKGMHIENSYSGNNTFEFTVFKD